MKGYRMVLLVNGGIFLFIAINGYLLGNVLERDAERCRDASLDDPRCQQTADTASTATRVAPIIAIGGIVLLALGTILGKPKPSRDPPAGTARPFPAPLMPEDWTKALRDSPDGLLIDLEVVPNSSSPGFPVGYNPWRNRIQARVAAEPQDGLANDELLTLIAAALTVPRSEVVLVDGHTSRRKRVAVRGMTAVDFTRRVAEARGEQ